MCPSDPGTFLPKCCACKYTVKLSLYHIDKGEDWGRGEGGSWGGFPGTCVNKDKLIRYEGKCLHKIKVPQNHVSIILFIVFSIVLSDDASIRRDSQGQVREGNLSFGLVLTNSGTEKLG